MEPKVKTLCIKALSLLSDAINANSGRSGDATLGVRLRRVSDDLDEIIEDFYPE